jgi:hypothetical protein
VLWCPHPRASYILIRLGIFKSKTRHRVSQSKNP